MAMKHFDDAFLMLCLYFVELLCIAAVLFGGSYGGAAFAIAVIAAVPASIALVVSLYEARLPHMAIASLISIPVVVLGVYCVRGTDPISIVLAIALLQAVLRVSMPRRLEVLNANICPSCNYSFGAISTETCPECGTKHPLRATKLWVDID